jgi:hypothetical protein
MAHQSDSSAQSGAEPLILEKLSETLGVGLKKRELTLPGGARVVVDGVSDDESVFVEVFAHQGPMKGGQPNKVARDALKLLTLARDRHEARLIIAFGDEQAARSVTQASWLAEALRTWGIEIFIPELDMSVRETLRATQLRQRMINPSD